jgi:hypothetical protein
VGDTWVSAIALHADWALPPTAETVPILLVFFLQNLGALVGLLGTVYTLIPASGL